MRAVVITRHGPPEVLEVRELPDPPVGAGRGQDRRQGGRDQLRRHPRPDRPLSRRAQAALRGRVRGRGRDRVGGGGGGLAQGRRPGDGRHPLQRARPSWSRSPRSRRCRLPSRLSFEEGAAFPVNYATAYAALVIMGGSEGGRAGADPRRRRRRGDRRHPDRARDRRGDLRHRLGVQARCDPRAGRGPPDRLPQPRLRAGGAQDHARRGRRRDHGRARPDLVPQGLPAASSRAGA